MEAVSRAGSMKLQPARQLPMNRRKKRNGTAFRTYLSDSISISSFRQPCDKRRWHNKLFQDLKKNDDFVKCPRQSFFYKRSILAICPYHVNVALLFSSPLSGEGYG